MAYQIPAASEIRLELPPQRSVTKNSKPTTDVSEGSSPVPPTSSESFSSGSDRNFLRESSASQSLATRAKQTLSGCWKTLISFLNWIFIGMRNTDQEVNLEDIHPFLWSIENYELSKHLLYAVGVAMLASLVFSNNPGVRKTGIRIAAATLPIDFTVLLIGLLLRKSFTKCSFLFQILGIILAIFALAASMFSFLPKALKCIPVFCGVVCFVMLAIPIPDLIYGRNVSEEARDLERGES